MQPVAKTLDHLQGESTVFLGDLIPTIIILRETLQTMKKTEQITICHPLLDSILQGIDQRFKEVLDREDCQIASSLHPRLVV